ncbi:MAG: DUF2911 domain-containing protein, partial [Chitinophagaceae bacterium]
IITQDFGLSTITIDYSRPSMKGRTIFGGLVPYNQEWRTGANAVTTIDFGQDVELEGHPVKAGKYALYTIPGEGEWTIILNKDVKNWGTQYSQSDDVLRFKVNTQQLPFPIETFTINMDNLRDSTATLYMIWGNTYVPVQVTTPIDNQIMSEIQDGMKSDKKPYIAAASYYLRMNRDLNTALGWVNDALKENPKGFNVYYLKAQIQSKMNNKSGAIASAKQGAELAKAANNDEYVKMNEQLISSLQ